MAYLEERITSYEYCLPGRLKIANGASPLGAPATIVKVAPRNLGSGARSTYSWLYE